MPKTIQITDIDFVEYRVFQQPSGDVFATVGFVMVTNTGDSLRGDETVELTGTAKQRAGALLQDIKQLIKARRGV